MATIDQNRGMGYKRVRSQKLIKRSSVQRRVEKGERGQIFDRDNSSKVPLGSQFRGRGELKSRKVMGDSETKVKVKTATPVTARHQGAKKSGSENLPRRGLLEPAVGWEQTRGES